MSPMLQSGVDLDPKMPRMDMNEFRQALTLISA